MYEYEARVVRVVDGDTLDLDIDLGLGIHVHERVRLARINAPETYGIKKDSIEYVAGTLTKNHLILLARQVQTFGVGTIKDKKGKYGRYIVEMWFTDNGKTINVSDHLVEKGLAEYKTY